MEQEGLEMRKMIDAGGIFSSITYDYKRVYSVKEMQKLLRDGYNPSYPEILGAYLFNVILTEPDEKCSKKKTK